MWPLGNNRWVYKLYGPLNVLGSFSYRYCRNGQCGSADDIQTVGAAPVGRQAATSLASQDIQDSISAWNWFVNPEPVTLITVPPPRGIFKGVTLVTVIRGRYVRSTPFVV